ncbi:protein phosphatase 2C domain-containing protein [Nocardioides sp. TF02-7]|uniref:PP2C family protein-serine/threonine phosphatase n=1 Tax=Nocardioides sp. TF02-7 TaxID=2917724 RepID=UPI001F06F59B|nr:protein phosphatase 2C domain-containing protein [Nocardioides sp. TF02-7]UMG91366.1 protein phosphatase 2C domain-containing protein [Nocardioides sp. TF02-7]
MTDAVLRHGAASHVGNVRELNEDAFLVAPPVFAVADGMGGHDHGDVAARFVVEELAALGGRTYDAATAVTAVAGALTAVHERIDAYEAAQRAAGRPLFSAGTTAVVAVLVEDPADPRWLLANLGDSRAYRVAGDRLEQVTVDHSLVQELVDAGTLSASAAAGHPDRHVVTRALGGPVRHDADFYSPPGGSRRAAAAVLRRCERDALRLRHPARPARDRAPRGGGGRRRRRRGRGRGARQRDRRRRRCDGIGRTHP